MRGRCRYHVAPLRCMKSYSWGFLSFLKFLLPRPQWCFYSHRDEECQLVCSKIFTAKSRRLKGNNNKQQKINIVILIILLVPMRILNISQSPYDPRCLFFKGYRILATMPSLKYKHHPRQVFNIIGPTDTLTRSFWK